MPEFFKFIPYLLVCSGVTYLIRMLPMVFFRKKIENRFIKSFLHYIPYTVLTAMTFPAIFYSTDSFVSALVGTRVAVVLAYFKRGLLVVAIGATAAVLICEGAMELIPLIT